MIRTITLCVSFWSPRVFQPANDPRRDVVRRVVQGQCPERDEHDRKKGRGGCCGHPETAPAQGRTRQRASSAPVPWPPFRSCPAEGRCRSCRERRPKRRSRKGAVCRATPRVSACHAKTAPTAIRPISKIRIRRPMRRSCPKKIRPQMRPSRAMAKSFAETVTRAPSVFVENGHGLRRESVPRLARRPLQ